MTKRRRASAGNLRFSSVNTTRQRVPLIQFEQIARAVLPGDYEVSLVFVGDAQALTLNIAHRQKHTPANVLSFPLSETAGEIFLNLERARREAPEFGTTYPKHLAGLFIHGLFHLKGFDHGGTMERAEEQVRRKFHL